MHETRTNLYETCTNLYEPYITRGLGLFSGLFFYIELSHFEKDFDHCTLLLPTTWPLSMFTKAPLGVPVCKQGH